MDQHPPVQPQPPEEEPRETLEDFKARIAIVIAGLRAYANATPEERQMIARMISNEPPEIDKDQTGQQG